MGRYVLRRLMQAIPMLVGISFAAFVLMRLAPGGPMAVYAQNPNLGLTREQNVGRFFAGE